MDCGALPLDEPVRLIDVVSETTLSKVSYTSADTPVRHAADAMDVASRSECRDTRP